MTPMWAVRLSREHADAAKALRQFAGVEVCEPAEGVWLRGEKADEQLERAIRKLPHAERFAVLADGQLVPAGRRVPRGTIPDRAAEWMTIQKWVTLDPQPAAFAGARPSRVTLRLVRSIVEREPNVLVTDMTRWLAYASGAAEVRLKRLMFAASADGRVLVRGSPLPPMAGDRFVEHEGVALPCGFEMSPPVETAVLRELTGLGAGDLAVFAHDASFERITAGDFVRASRSAVRMTAEGATQ